MVKVKKNLDPSLTAAIEFNIIGSTYIFVSLNTINAGQVSNLKLDFNTGN